MSKSRDVQDLIAEFVSSKNQLLHEEIISSIKKESFAHLEEQEEAVHQDPLQEIISEELPIECTDTHKKMEPIQEESLKEVVAGPINIPLDMKSNLEDSIRDLTRQNTLLREELAKMNAPSLGDSLPQKAMSSDDLRMEFLNFTSAHIQQFNHRIKKTEELIEALGQKSQQQPEKKAGNGFPVWLQWANLIALLLIASYFIIQFFTKSTSEPVTDNGKHLSKQSVVAAAPVSKSAVSRVTPNKETPLAKSISTLPQPSTPVQTPQAPAPTPFRKSAASAPQTATPAMKVPNAPTKQAEELASSRKNTPITTSSPFSKGPINTPALAKAVPSKGSVPLRTANPLLPQKVPVNKPAISASKVASIYPNKSATNVSKVIPDHRTAKSNPQASSPMPPKEKVAPKRIVESPAKLPNIVRKQSVSKPASLPAKEYKPGNSTNQQLASTQASNTKRATANLPKPTLQNTASIVNAKPAAEKKVLNKEKVYFGED